MLRSGTFKTERIRFFSSNPAQLKKSGSDLNSNEKKIYLYFRQVRIKFDLINHDFQLELVDSGLYFIQDENNFIYPLLQAGSDEKSIDPDSAGRKLTDPDLKPKLQLLRSKQFDY